MSLLCFIILIFSAVGYGKSKLRQNNSTDAFIYLQVFNLVIGFDRAFEKAENEQNKLLYKEYFQRTAKLTDEQNQILKAIAYSFMQSFPSTRPEEKLNLILRYKNDLRKSFGVYEFRKFDSYVKEKIGRNLEVSRSGDLLTIGGSNITIVGSGNELYIQGYAVTFAFSLNAQQVENCAVSATLTGQGVNLSGSDTDPTCADHNPMVTLNARVYVPNTQYCINANHTRGMVTQTTGTCSTAPNPSRVKSITYELIATDDLQIDANPNAGGGLRIFPDKKTPNETTDRRKIRVRAKYYQTTPDIRIYFRNFDVDDPSANSAPIDDEPTPNAGNDNNGNVDGTTATKAGKFLIPQSPNPNPDDCQPFANGVSCLTDSNGDATVEFMVTMQPGDNFTVAASDNENYLNGLTLNTDGINLKDTDNVQIPVTRTAENGCNNISVIACRTDMLTVWRRLHIEVDSMGNVGNSNQMTVTVNGAVTIPRSGVGGPGIGTVNISDTLLPDVYSFGRLVVGNRSLIVQSNAANSLTVVNTTERNINISNGANLTLYDDDDYNADDSPLYSGNISSESYLVDGDAGEAIVQLPDSFKYLSTDDGNYPDGKPKNVYASAYIKPEYNWAQNVANYNQTNLTFELNVEFGINNSTLINVVNRDRNSTNDERDDFWIAYVLTGYQGPVLNDFDGLNSTGTANETALQGAAPNIFLVGSEIPSCDCYQSSNCPAGGIVCNLPNGTPKLPRGALGSIIFQEVNQDLKRYFAVFQSPARPFDDIELTIPHEIGHQFGLLGDQKRSIFKIMDYSDYLNNVVNDVAFHQEHINIMRRRIKSPGQ